MNMAYYVLYAYDGTFKGRTLGRKDNITSAKKKAYNLVMNTNSSIDILDASTTSDIYKMRIVASVHYVPTIGKVAYASHTTGKINQLTSNGAVVGFAWNEKDHVYPD